MGSTSTLSLYSHPKISFPAQPLKRAREAVGGATNYCAPGVLFPATPPYISRRRCWRSKSLVVRSDGGPRRPASNRRVYKQSQSQAASFPVKEIASFIVPAGAFVAITFGIAFAAFNNIFNFLSHKFIGPSLPAQIYYQVSVQRLRGSPDKDSMNWPKNLEHSEVLTCQVLTLEMKDYFFLPRAWHTIRLQRK
ncbi:hypothetical protein CsSME_00037034 [Camellia sinensis var. sinensis]